MKSDPDAGGFEQIRFILVSHFGDTEFSQTNKNLTLEHRSLYRCTPPLARL